MQIPVNHKARKSEISTETSCVRGEKHFQKGKERPTWQFFFGCCGFSTFTFFSWGKRVVDHLRISFWTCLAVAKAISTFEFWFCISMKPEVHTVPATVKTWNNLMGVKYIMLETALWCTIQHLHRFTNENLLCRQCNVGLHWLHCHVTLNLWVIFSKQRQSFHHFNEVSSGLQWPPLPIKDCLSINFSFLNVFE